MINEDPRNVGRKSTHDTGDRTTAATTLLSFEQFLTQYSGDKRYELIDGEVFDLEPTGPHEQVGGFITKQTCFQIVVEQLPWTVLQRPLCRPPNTEMTAFRPDVAVIDEVALMHEPLWPEQSILTRGSSIQFVAEVVSSNWQNHYSRKMEDYAALGISEYWIADYAALGGIKHIETRNSQRSRFDYWSMASTTFSYSRVTMRSLPPRSPN